MHTQHENKDLRAQYAQLFQGSVEMRRPPIGGVPPPLPKKSPSMGNLTLVGLPGSDRTATSKTVPTPAPRVSVRATSMNDIAAGTSKGPENVPVGKPTIIRSGFGRTRRDSEPNAGDVPDGRCGADPGGAFGVRLRSSAEQGEVPQSKESTEHKAASVPASDSAQGWRASSEKKPPPVKPKPALLPKPALKPKPSPRPKSMFEPREKPSVDDAGQDTLQKSAPAWMPKLKPTLHPKSTSSEDAGSKEDHRTPGPIPMKATYRPTIIRASRPKPSNIKEKAEEEPRDRTVSPPATAPKPQTKRKPTIIRPKNVSKPATETKECTPEERVFVPTPLRAAQSMPNIAKREELRAAVPSEMVSSPIHKSASEEELENVANDTLEQEESSHVVQHDEDDLDKLNPVNYNTKPMTTKVGPAKPPPPRPSSGPKKLSSKSFERAAR